MLDLNKPNLFNFLLLASFICGARYVSAYNDKQRENTANTQLQNNTSEPPQTKKMDDQVAIQNSYIFRRRIRDTNGTLDHERLECLSCFGYGNSKKDANCYSGNLKEFEKCEPGQICFTEIHKMYIKRGCLWKNKLNRTFACKCPLCNDKPSDDPTYYQYEDINDWKYDNRRLQTSLVGINLICKVCETKGTNAVADKSCKEGKNADYMVCAHNQVCYTNIDNGTEFISRGCMNKPAYNPFYAFCNQSRCNSQYFTNPRTKVLEEKLSMITRSAKVLVSKGDNIFKNYIMIGLVAMLSRLSTLT